MSYILCDPPEGWKYGFPKAFTFTPSHPNLPGEEFDRELKAWFVDAGYPRSLVEKGYLNHCRYIGDINNIKKVLNET